MAFHMTSAAAQEILAAAARSGAEGMALRIAARRLGQDLDFAMGFDEPAPDDEVARFDGLTVLMAPQSQPWLERVVVDYVELDGGGRDFIFMQPDAGCASQAKGCGSGGCSRCG